MLPSNKQIFLKPCLEIWKNFKGILFWGVLVAERELVVSEKGAVLIQKLVQVKIFKVLHSCIFFI